TLCDAEAVAAGAQGDASRAACGAVLAARRAELLAALVQAADPALAAALAEARYEAAAHALGRRRAPLQRWREAHPAALELLRQAAEARADGAWFPPLVATDAFQACTAPDAACWRTVRAALGPRPADPPDLAAWRSTWCADLPADRAEACEAEVDLIAAGAPVARD
ncbi:MAG: hypothetical protein R3F59_06750, partial [Myxococcota bacterium]